MRDGHSLGLACAATGVYDVGHLVRAEGGEEGEREGGRRDREKGKRKEIVVERETGEGKREMATWFAQRTLK